MVPTLVFTDNTSSTTRDTRVHQAPPSPDERSRQWPIGPTTVCEPYPLELPRSSPSEAHIAVARAAASLSRSYVAAQVRFLRSRRAPFEVARPSRAPTPSPTTTSPG